MKKTLVLILSLIMSMSVFVGCGAKGGQNVNSDDDILDENYELPEVNFDDTLKIKVMRKGYGTQFIHEITKAYKVINPEVEFIIEEDPNIGDTVKNEIGIGPDDNETDIYFGADVDFANYFELEDDKYTDVDGNANKSYLTNLNNFLHYWSPYDSDKKMMEVIDQSMMDMLTFDRRVYALPWAAGACGLVYNEELFNEVGVAVPTTTNELIATIEQFQTYNKANPSKDKIIPFIWAGGDSAVYWDYVTYVWWSQYEGADMFKKYWTLHDGDLYDPKVEYLDQEGQLKSLEVLQELVKDNERSYVGSFAEVAVDAEKDFVNGKPGYRFAMMPCGDWFEREVSGLVGKDNPKLKNFKMMKTPKLSAAIEKNGGDASKVPDYAYTLATTHNLFIPAYSQQRDLAYDFVSYLYSAEGCKLFTKETGSFLPVRDTTYLDNDELTLSKMTPFQKSQYEIVKSTDYIYASFKLSPMRYAGGMKEIPDAKLHPSKAMTPHTPADKNDKQFTAQEVWTNFKDYFQSQWNVFKTKAGM